MKDKVINDLLKRISDLEFEVEKQDKEIERLKEEYMILQNASDEVEEEKDKEIERLNNIISKVKVDINNMKEIIRKQPSEDEDTDAWIQVRLSGLLYIIEGSE